MRYSEFMPTDAEVFLKRTQQLSDVRELVRSDPYPSATALLSVHSAIALNDAVLTILTGSPYKGQGHRQAINRTKSICKAAKLEYAGVRHLANLIRKKTDISYGDHETTPDEAEKLAYEAERFETWAYKLLKNRGITVRGL